jgi:hypothetical protein
MTTIFLVASGAWSYKTIHCAFPTKELALAYIEEVKLARFMAAAANDEDQWRDDPYVEELPLFDAVPRVWIRQHPDSVNPWAVVDYGVEWRGVDE